MQSITDQFLAFCKSKKADEAYDYMDIQNCACGQFATSLGWGGDEEDSLRTSVETRFSALACTHPRTFGSLADRLSSARRFDDGGGM